MGKVHYTPKGLRPRSVYRPRSLAEVPTGSYKVVFTSESGHRYGMELCANTRHEATKAVERISGDRRAGLWRPANWPPLQTIQHGARLARQKAVA